MSDHDSELPKDADVCLFSVNGKLCGARKASVIHKHGRLCKQYHEPTWGCHPFQPAVADPAPVDQREREKLCAICGRSRNNALHRTHKNWREGHHEYEPGCPSCKSPRKKERWFVANDANVEPEIYTPENSHLCIDSWHEADLASSAALRESEQGNDACAIADRFLETLPAREQFPINRTETVELLAKFYEVFLAAHSPSIRAEDSQ